MAEQNMTDKFIEVKNCLVYLWIMLPNHQDTFINEVQKLCFEFKWDRKRDKIKRSFVIHNALNGGINIPDIKTY